MRKARVFSANSPDWWRQVGAITVRNGVIITEAFNDHLPDQNANYCSGDIRDFIKAGEKTEISSALHAEQAIIARSARDGISLKGADIYVTVFPCPVCAKLIAEAGFTRCFFNSGWANFDAEPVLKSRGIELIFVQLPEDKERMKNYE